MTTIPHISQRGVRTIGCALLFCAFAYGYFSWLIGEQLSAQVAPWFLIAPKWWGLMAVLACFPLSFYWFRRLGHTLSTLSLLARIFLVFFLIGWLTPSNELDTLELRTARLAAQGQYEEALRIGARSHLCSHKLVSLRCEILQRQSPTSLPLHFFDYSLPLEVSATHLKPIQHPYRNKLPSHTPQQHVQLLGLLLDRRLDAFAQALLSSSPTLDSLPPIYLQALLLHQRLSPDATFKLHHPTTQANYQDFIDYRKKVQAMPLLQRAPSQRAEANLLYPLYGNTYWWYYYYNRSLPN